MKKHSYQWLIPLFFATNSLALAASDTLSNKSRPLQEQYPMPLFGRLPVIESKGNYFLSIGGLGIPRYRELKGGWVEVGYNKEFLGVDFRWTSAAANYSRIRVKPNSTDAVDAVDLYLPTLGDPSSWNYSLLEPGISIMSNPLMATAPWLSERTRISLSWANLSCVEDKVSFAGVLVGAESSLGIQLGSNSPVMLWSGLAWHFGMTKPSQAMPNAVRVNLSWVQGNFWLSYHF